MKGNVQEFLKESGFALAREDREAVMRAFEGEADAAYMSLEDFSNLHDYDWHGRLMFGTDLPVWQAHEKIDLTMRYREYVRAFAAVGIENVSQVFQNYSSIRP